MSRNWTENQRDAINSRRGDIVVSAAAGSGKTAVLVERVIQRLTDRENPTSADRLLIVTFTKAAANEMLERITAAVEALLRENPGDANLIRQQMLLPSAKICTIDSFCASLVKENFELLDFSPETVNAEEGELEIIKNDSVNEALCFMYDEGGESFRRLSELLFRGRDDSYLAETVKKLYESSRSFPFPSAWLDSLCDEFDNTRSLGESIYGKIIISYVSDCLDYAVDIADYILCESEGNQDYTGVFFDAVSEDKRCFTACLDCLSQGKWDEAREIILGFSPARRGRAPKGLKEDTFFDSLVYKRDTCSKKVKALKEHFSSSEKDFIEDMEFFAPLVKALVETVKLYGEIYSRNKKEKKLADFSDIAHGALKLLVERTEQGYEKTEKAKEIAEAYDEILIDEYQDTNEAQDMLFTAISRNNLFRVGDVKQSIYGFRQAMPEIFISLKERYALYDREKDNYPAKIVLGNNFRSRKGVTDIINFIFDALMSKSCGAVDYNEEERLVPSAFYEDENRLGAELHFLETGDLVLESSDENQARYIAKIIKEMINSSFTVKGENGERRATYGDFAVLLRSAKSRSHIYADAFRKMGVPSFAEPTGSFLDSAEIALALNILRIIDNPKQDIPLLSVMLSPLFSFTPDDISQYRIESKRGDIYSCLLFQEEKGNERVKAFNEKIRHWRRISLCRCIRDLIGEVFENTAILNIFDAVDPTGMKRSNLMLLTDYADTYEKTGSGGLSGFVRFIDRLKHNKKDLTACLGQVQSADAVKIMSIHKSKGLEFPVCIIGACGGRFNKTDERENLLVSLKHGLGIVKRDIDTFDQYDTVCHSAVKLSKGMDGLSEELRVLYVALTRAKERLIMVYGTNNIETTLKKCFDNINPKKEKISPFLVSSAGGMGEWIVTALMRHKDAAQLRESIGCREHIALECDSPLKVVISSMEEDIMPSQTADRESFAQPDAQLFEAIDERVSFRYKYEALSGVLMKRAASEVDKEFVDREYFASSMPSFLSDAGLTGAQKGIATHTFMQFADYAKASTDVKGEINRLSEKGIITEKQAEAINISAVEHFFESELARRILSSDCVMREKKFTVEVPINEVYEGTDEFADEKVMIQGIADCAFLERGELVVVDYKTDRLRTEEDFIEKYASQVKLYKKALSLCTDYAVKETVLYSFYLGKAIAVI
ncbi:MAG: helicase-exonuclease AddAB subunit AddA [Clostridia bacterium]|nr:helicase-exonuclease AddAB subunit AddA [Clostridia bacterium]